MQTITIKLVEILLVEDNEGDILLTRVALEEAGIKFHLNEVRDGKEAIDFLYRQGNYVDAVVPDIILLDINLPKKNGHEVLKYVKGNLKLKHIPVIMLTTSSSEKDIKMANENFADDFITKPSDVTEFLSLVAEKVSMWIDQIHKVNQ